MSIQGLVDKLFLLLINNRSTLLEGNEDEEEDVLESIENINANWIREKMAHFGVPNPRKLAIQSGVNYESLTQALNGKRLVSSEIKKSLFWYFKFLNALNF